MLWLPFHYLVIGLGSLAIARGWLPWPARLALSLLMGVSFAGLTFVAHEALHGSIVRGRRLRRAIGRLGFLPFCVPPRLWEAWHNRVHHGHTNHPGSDPDAYPTLAEYEGSPAVRRVTDWLAPGRRRVAGVFSLLVGFSVQSSHMLLTAARRGYLSRGQHRWALLEAGSSWALLVALAIAAGPLTFALAFGLPLIVGNAIIMSFILTNHSLSPHTDVNDPLMNSLSLTLPRFFDWLTLGFGHHVEHHLFPAMSGRHARELGAEVRRLWPERHQSLPYLRALRLLHRSPRVYRTATLLFDPRTGNDWPALLPAVRVSEASPPIEDCGPAHVPPSYGQPRTSPANLIVVSLAASVACSAPALRTPPASEPPAAPATTGVPSAERSTARPQNEGTSWDPHAAPPATDAPPAQSEAPAK
ncbi:MAG TPA: acyl-CoA desaturase [Polyangiaceae bacterium]|nr:acyl-CoA desaturase [Polyangiaceae bacterium]